MTEQANDTNHTAITESLASLRLPELQKRFEQVVGESTRCPNRNYLIRRITETLEQQTQQTTLSQPEPEQQQAPREEHVQETATQEEPTADESRQHSVAASSPDETMGQQPSTDSAAQQSTEQATAPDPSSDQGNSRPKLSKLTVPELQALYLEVLGRPTGSSHKRYLIWKIRQAQRGLVPVGPRRIRASGDPATEHKVLPLRMEAEQVARLDEARQRLGLKNRMDLFRRALHAYLEAQGEPEVAALFATDATTEA